MAHTQRTRRTSPEVRRRSPIPMPAGEEREPPLTAWLRPSLLAPRPLERRDPRPPQRLLRLRQRLLTRPVRVAMVVSLVWRRVAAVAAVPKVLARAGLGWRPPLPVRPHARTTRLDGLPAAVMGQRCAEVWTRLPAQAAPSGFHPSWAPGREHCPVLASGEGSTLDARRQRTQVLRAREGVRRAGKTLVLVAACSHRPRGQRSTEDVAANDQRCAAGILAALPVGGLVVFDRGGCSFLWGDDGTAAPKFCVTRRREKTASRPVPVLSGSPYDRDARLPGGP